MHQNRGMSCASALSDQRLYCSLPRYYDTPSFYIWNFKPPPSFCGCAGRFVSYLIANLEDRFSHEEAHIILWHAGRSTTVMHAGLAHAFEGPWHKGKIPEWRVEKVWLRIRSMKIRNLHSSWNTENARFYYIFGSSYAKPEDTPIVFLIQPLVEHQIVW